MWGKNTEYSIPFELPSEKRKISKMFHEIVSQKKVEEKSRSNEPYIICFRNRNGIYVFTPCGHALLCELCCVTLMSQYDDGSKKLHYLRRIPIQDLGTYIKVFFPI